jgi:hypothetical protein
MPSPQRTFATKSDRKLMFEQAWLVASREYRERVRSRAFLLTTLLTPVFLGAILGGSVVMAMQTPTSASLSPPTMRPRRTRSRTSCVPSSRGPKPST